MVVCVAVCHCGSIVCIISLIFYVCMLYQDVKFCLLRMQAVFRYPFLAIVSICIISVVVICYEYALFHEMLLHCLLMN